MSARTGLCGVVSRTRSWERGAVSEMKEGPSEPACRSRLQTAVSCCRPMAVVVNVTEKAWNKLRHVWVRETNASEPLMRPRNRSTDGIKTGAPPLSGKSMAETWYYWPCGVRGTGGVTLILALVWNLRTCSAVVREKAQAAAPRGQKYRYAGQGRTVP